MRPHHHFCLGLLKTATGCGSDKQTYSKHWAKRKVGNWTEVSKESRQSGESIIRIYRAALKQDRQAISNTLVGISNIEEHAYSLLRDAT